MVACIQIRNPRIREIVAEEAQHGVGRNATEAAENLIAEAAERRRMDRARQQPAPSQPALAH